MDEERRCEVCGELLKLSQYARGEQVDGNNKKDNLACRNYPNCPKAEKE